MVISAFLKREGRRIGSWYGYLNRIEIGLSTKMAFQRKPGIQVAKEMGVVGEKWGRRDCEKPCGLGGRKRSNKALETTQGASTVIVNKKGAHWWVLSKGKLLFFLTGPSDPFSLLHHPTNPPYIFKKYSVSSHYHPPALL